MVHKRKKFIFNAFVGLLKPVERFENWNVKVTMPIFMVIPGVSKDTKFVAGNQVLCNL